jgi:hypothetical protein
MICQLLPYIAIFDYLKSDRRIQVRETSSKHVNIHFQLQNLVMPVMAGTSKGPINIATIVSYVAENNMLEGSSDRLNEFWEYLCLSVISNCYG